MSDDAVKTYTLPNGQEVTLREPDDMTPEQLAQFDELRHAPRPMCRCVLEPVPEDVERCKRYTPAVDFGFGDDCPEAYMEEDAGGEYVALKDVEDKDAVKPEGFTLQFKGPVVCDEGRCPLCSARWVATRDFFDSDCSHMDAEYFGDATWHVTCPSAFAPAVQAVRALGVKVW